MKLLIVCNHMGIGGIRQSLLNFLSNINKEKYDIELQLLRYDTTYLNNLPQLTDIKLCAPFPLLDIYYTSLSKLRKQKCYSKIIIKAILVLLRKIVGAKSIIDFLVLISRRAQKYDIAISYANDIWYDNGGFSGGC